MEERALSLISSWMWCHCELFWPPGLSAILRSSLLSFALPMAAIFRTSTPDYCGRVTLQVLAPWCLNLLTHCSSQLRRCHCFFQGLITEAAAFQLLSNRAQQSQVWMGPEEKEPRTHSATVATPNLRTKKEVARAQLPWDPPCSLTFGRSLLWTFLSPCFSYQSICHEGSPESPWNPALPSDSLL